MSLLIELIQSKRRKNDDPNKLTQKDMVNHHLFGGDLVADGFISPIALPRQRIQELMGNSTVDEMAKRCHISADDLQKLLDHDFLEPTALQYYNIANAFNVSVMWLMGYHTQKEREIGIYDNALISKLSQRNAAESRLYNIQSKGAVTGLIRKTLENKVHNESLKISNLAARITAKEHLPLSDEELYMLAGQPVYLEYSNEETCWGIPDGDDIVTATGREKIELNEQKYFAYLTPDTSVKFDD